MRATLRSSFIVLPVALLGCGSSTGSDSAEAEAIGAVVEDDDAVETEVDESGFPPPREGYERFFAPTLAGVEPGADVTYCQYIRAPSDRALDIIDVDGHQSAGGHHAVAYATTVDAPVGQSGPCVQEDNMSGAFLGGIGGEAGTGTPLPEGVVFRLAAGSAIMLNTHFLNTTSETIDGRTVLDVKFAEVDDERLVASMFTSGNMGFEVPPGEPLQVTADCELPRDLDFVLFANHMHDYGTSVKTELVRADTGEVELIHEDPIWTYEMQFDGVYRRWEVDAPLRARTGDVFRTTCNWENPTGEPLNFPREMCFSVGFFISDGSTAPVCINGNWIERAADD
jgi:hypothetical protein